MNSPTSSPLQTDTVLLGSQTPRIWTPPTPNAESKGRKVGALCELAGFTLDEWQSTIIAIGSEHAADRWLHRLVAFVVARQNGKTEVFKARALAGLFLFGEHIIHTAQDRETVRDFFAELVELIEATPALSRQLHPRKGIREANGQEAIRLKSGARYKLVAPRAKAIRGEKPPPDLILLDEIREHRTADLWAAAVPTGRTRPNFQIWVTSNAGEPDSVVLNQIRDRGRLAAKQPGSDPGIVWLEWSAAPDRAIDDRRGWVESNPALGIRITEETIVEELKDYENDENGFRTEILCQWVETAGQTAYNVDRWLECAHTEPVHVEPGPPRPLLGIDIDGDRTHAAIAIAAKRDGRLVVDVVADWHDHDGVDITDVATTALAWMKRYKIREFAYDRYTAATIAAMLEAKGRRPHPITAVEFVTAAGNLQDAITTGFLSHRNNETLNDEMIRTVRKDRGDGHWFVSRQLSEGTVSGVLAVMFAVHLAYQPKRSATVHTGTKTRK